MELLASRTAGFAAPQGVAMVAGAVAVVDTGHHEIVWFEGDLATVTAIRRGGRGTTFGVDGLLFPMAAVFLDATQLLVADTRNGHLDLYQDQPAGWTFMRSVNGVLAASAALVDLARETVSSVLTLDASANQVSRVDVTAGTATALLSDPIWEQPIAIAAGDGFIWIADQGRHEVRRYDAATLAPVVVASYGQTPGRVKAPRGLAYDSVQARLYVAEAGGRISTFSRDGAFIELAALPTGAHDLWRIACDATGMVCVADATSAAVHLLRGATIGPRLTVDPARIDFGAVQVGHQLPLTVRVTNQGDAAISVLRVVVEGAAFTTGSAAFNLPAGGQTDLSLTFGPAREGLHAGRLRIETSAIAQPSLSALVVGSGARMDSLSLALVLDRSGSMVQPSGVVSKIERLRAASSMLVDLLATQPSASLSLVPFSSAAGPVLPLRPVTSAALADTHAAIDALTAGGSTSIGAGLAAGFEAVAEGESERRILLVVSDGIENMPPMIADVPRLAGANIYAVGLGLPQYLDTAKLTELSTTLGGYFQVTDGDDARLSKFFVQVFSDMTDQEIALDPVASFDDGQRRDFFVWVSSGDVELTIVLQWDRPGSVFELELVSPAGVHLSPDRCDWLGAGPRHLIVRLRLRGGRWRASGRWRIRVRAAKLDGKDERAAVAATVRSDYSLDWRLINRSPRLKPSKPEDDHVSPSVPMFPHRGRPVAASGRLRVGDRVALQVQARHPQLRMTMVGAIASLRAPLHSLADQVMRSKERDLDRMERPPDPKGSRFTKPRAIRVKAGSTSQIDVALPLEGPDGVYEARIRVEARAPSGERIQRERFLQLLVDR